MNRICQILLLVVGLIWMQSSVGHSCTAFSMRQGGNALVGINYDSQFGDGVVVVNKRGVSKTAIGLNPGPLARWTSKYGSITFCQYGRELVQSGINEAGLFVAALLLPETQWPYPDSRPSIRSAQWVQYQLDNSADVEEVIRSDKNVRISMAGSSTVHFFVCDKIGNCAVIEFLKGKPFHRFGAELPIKVLTDSLYSQCVQSLGSGKIPQTDRAFAVKRFMETANMIKETSSWTADPVDAIFKMLKKAEHSSKWSIVYDLNALRVHFHSVFNEKTRQFSLSEFDFSCNSPVKVLDVQAPFSGAVGATFSDYTVSGNRDLIEKAFRKTKSLSSLPSYIVDEYSLYPESLVCTMGGAKPQ